MSRLMIHSPRFGSTHAVSVVQYCHTMRCELKNEPFDPAFNVQPVCRTLDRQVALVLLSLASRGGCRPIYIYIRNSKT
jgi:hypothetical protein